MIRQTTLDLDITGGMNVVELAVKRCLVFTTALLLMCLLMMMTLHS